MVRAKFTVNTNKDNGSTDPAYKGSEINLSAVYSGSPENEIGRASWRATVYLSVVAV